eukprot:gene14880-6013_t
MEMMSRGYRSRKLESLKVGPNLSYWAPFIGKQSRIANVIYNSEHLKVHRDDENVEVECREMSEERLLETLFESSSKDVRLLARKLGVSSKGTKLDIINRIKTGLGKNNVKFNKIFRKMFGFSGGWLTVACRHGIIYALKFLLRSESPRDYIDILRGLKHRPNIFINDMAHIVAAFGNRNFDGFFSPNEGRAAEATEENVQMANEGALQLSFPWINSSAKQGNDADANCHPITGSAHHLALFDRLHERNSSNEVEALRRIACINELCGQINSQVAEQIHGSFNLNRYFLNKMSPSNHIFMFRSIIDLTNEARNRQVISEMEKRTRLVAKYDKFGRAILAHSREEDQFDDDHSSEESVDRSFVGITSIDPIPWFDEVSFSKADQISKPDYEEFVNGFVQDGIRRNLSSSPNKSFENQLKNRCPQNINISITSDIEPEDTKGPIDDLFPLDVEEPLDFDNTIVLSDDDLDCGKVIDSHNVVLDSAANIRSFDTSPSINNIEEPGANSAKVDECEINLNEIESGLPLTCSVINAAMDILRHQFPSLGGLSPICNLNNMWGSGRSFVQIIPFNDLGDGCIEWGTLSNVLSSRTILLYDSLVRNHLSKNKRECKYDISVEGYAARLRHPKKDSFEIHVADTTSSLKNADNGIAAIFYALSLCRKLDPQVIYYNYKTLRQELFKALNRNSFEGVQFADSPREPSGTKFVIKPVLYCHCNLPDLKTKMICCEKCKAWYHNDCESDINSSPWLCKKCKHGPKIITVHDSDENDNLSLQERSRGKMKIRRGVKGGIKKKREGKIKKKASFKELLAKVQLRSLDESSQSSDGNF